MNLKSYIRGIGIGIIVTAAVFLISGSGDKATMTDAEVIARAKELGMTEAVTTLAQAKDEQAVVGGAKATEEEKPTEEVKPTEEAKPAEEAKPTEEIKPTEEVKPTEEAKPTEEVKPTEEAKPTKEVKPTEEVKPTKEVKPTEEAKPTKAVISDDDDIVIIVVNKGDGSDTVSRKLYEAGIVADAHEFDVYLMSNGYDRKITTGNHKIRFAASKEEIAKNLITSTN